MFETLLKKIENLNTFSSISEFLDNNYARLGRGLDAIVWNLNSEYVIKIAHVRNSFDFIDYCLNNQNDPHIPSIYHYELKYNDDTGEMFYIMILEHLNHSKNCSNVVSILNVYTGNGSKAEQHIVSTFIRQNPRNEGIFESFSKVVSNVRNNLDLHGDNIMVRNNGVFVFTDIFV